MQEPPVKSTPLTAYVYLLVRADLPAHVRTVQSSHAAIAATFAFGEPEATHPHLVVCQVLDERTLADEFNRLKELGVRCCCWTEDDMNHEMTAVATAPLRGAERRPMRKYKLLD